MSTVPVSVGGNAGSSNCSGPKPATQTVSKKMSNVDDALDYLDLVKLKYVDQPDIYYTFLEVMKDFKSAKIDTFGVIRLVTELFKDHLDLLSGFNSFLQPGYSIQVHTIDTGYKIKVIMPPKNQKFTNTSHADDLLSAAIQKSENRNLKVPEGECSSQSISGGATEKAMSNYNSSSCSSSGNNKKSGAGAGVCSSSFLVRKVNPMAQHLPPPSQSQSPVCVLPPAAGGSQSAPAVAAVTSSPSPTMTSSATTGSENSNQNQPLEFSNALKFVNKIKNRFYNEPEKYQKFLDILKKFQDEQKLFKKSGKHCTETDIYSKVAKLFENQEDLLSEFGQFLPDAINIKNVEMNFDNENSRWNKHGCSSSGNKSCPGLQQLANTLCNRRIPTHRPPLPIAISPARGDNNNNNNSDGANGDESQRQRKMPAVSMVNQHHPTRCPTKSNFSGHHPHHNQGASHVMNHGRSSTSNTHCPVVPYNGNGNPAESSKRWSSVAAQSLPLKKRQKVYPHCNVNAVDNLHDYEFFDRFRNGLGNEKAYKDFLRCIVLYNKSIVSGEELIQLVQPFFGQFRGLYRYFKNFVRRQDKVNSKATPTDSCGRSQQNGGNGNGNVEPVPSTSAGGSTTNCNTKLSEFPSIEQPDIDYLNCKQIGESYRALPDDFVQPRCTGRTLLCKQVLNDKYVLYPNQSEDSFETIKKTRYERFSYRTEDERFELDIVLEVNAATIRVLEGVQKKLNKLSPVDLQKYKLDDCLGGNSRTIHRRALQRIYGDKADDMIDGLKKNPAVAVPLILKRLKSKEQEWRDAQKSFNRVWREETEKYFQKSSEYNNNNHRQPSMNCNHNRMNPEDVSSIMRNYVLNGTSAKYFKFDDNGAATGNQNGCNDDIVKDNHSKTDNSRQNNSNEENNHSSNNKNTKKLKSDKNKVGGEGEDDGSADDDDAEDEAGGEEEEEEEEDLFDDSEDIFMARTIIKKPKPNKCKATTVNNNSNCSNNNTNNNNNNNNSNKFSSLNKTTVVSAGGCLNTNSSTTVVGRPGSTDSSSSSSNNSSSSKLAAKCRTTTHTQWKYMNGSGNTKHVNNKFSK